jgi:hypothetical protein
LGKWDCAAVGKNTGTSAAGSAVDRKKQTAIGSQELCMVIVSLKRIIRKLTSGSRPDEQQSEMRATREASSNPRSRRQDIRRGHETA